MASLEGGLGAIAFSSGLAAQLCTVLSRRAGRRSSRLHAKRLRRNRHAAQRYGQAHGHRDDVRPGRRPRCGARRDPPANQAALRRDGRQPVGRRRRSARLRSARARSGHPARRRQHLRDAVSLPADRASAPTSSCTRRRSSSTGTARRSAACWSNRESSRGITDAFRCSRTPSPGYHRKVFTETFGEYAFLMRARAEVLRDVGAPMAPMDAWLMLLGLETLELRMERHVGNARAVANFLKDRPEVAWVREPELGSIFTFGLRGGREAARRFIDALELWSHLANVGDAKSLVIASGFDDALAALRRGAAQGRRRARERSALGRTRRGRRFAWDLGNALRAAACASS